MNNRSFGHIGEASAAIFLEQQGFEVIGKNVYVGHCEIDVLETNGDLLLFVEVKTRRQVPDTHSFYGRPASAVTATKRKNLLDAARRYLYENREQTKMLQPRIDIIEVYVDPSSPTYKVLDIRHFPNAVHG